MGGGAMLTPVAGGVIGCPPDSLSDIQKTNNFRSSSFSSQQNLQSSYLAETSTNNLESVGIRRRRRSISSNYDSVFGPVPSRIEVEKAMFDIQRYMHEILSSEPEFSWLQQILNRNEPTTSQTPGFKRLYDAYRLLQTDPSVQRMVASISSDKAVWDALLKNQAVQDLSGSLYTDLSSITDEAEGKRVESSDEERDFATLILNWILGKTKVMIGELMEKFGLLVMEKFGLLVSEIFQQKPTSKRTDAMEENFRSSLLLSVVILVIVVVGRIGGI